ncbi:MAG TPA: cytochrome c maturation protein CcmE [Gaiellaceae bacterium]|nr:cytochrome c maturation protein CcmE [Gaiellaceae bacterium]
MNRTGSPARLVVALSVAATLAVFLLYTSLAGGATPTIQPSALDRQHGVVELAGVVLGPVDGDPQGAGMRFALRDDKGPGRVRVLYRGAVPDLFARGRHVLVRGELRGGVFVAQRDSLVTKCPSKYVPKKTRA